MDTMRPFNSEFVVTRNEIVQRGRSPEPYYETSSDESEVEQISAEHSDVEQTSQEHSEAEQSSSAESEENGPSPSTSKGLLPPHKRRNEMRVREDRKQSEGELTYAELLELTKTPAEQRGRSPESYYETSSDESEVEQISAEHSDVEQTSQEHSEEEQSSSTKSEDSGPVPSTSKEIAFQLKRRMQMTVREDRKKFRPNEKNLPNLLIEKVGRQSVVALDLTAIPIRDLGGRNPRRILMKIISVEEKPSSGQAKLVLWDADARDEEKIQKIMNKPIFIESSWINWYHGFKGEYQIRVTPGFDIVLLKHATKIYPEVNDGDGEIQEKRIKNYDNETESEGEILEDENEDSDNSEEEEEKLDINGIDTCHNENKWDDESEDNCEEEVENEENVTSPSKYL